MNKENAHLYDGDVVIITVVAFPDTHDIVPVNEDGAWLDGPYNLHDWFDGMLKPDYLEDAIERMEAASRDAVALNRTITQSIYEVELTFEPIKAPKDDDTYSVGAYLDDRGFHFALGYLQEAMPEEITWPFDCGAMVNLPALCDQINQLLQFRDVGDDDENVPLLGDFRAELEQLMAQQIIVWARG